MSITYSINMFLLLKGYNRHNNVHKILFQLPGNWDKPAIARGQAFLARRLEICTKFLFIRPHSTSISDVIKMLRFVPPVYDPKKRQKRKENSDYLATSVCLSVIVFQWVLIVNFYFSPSDLTHQDMSHKLNRRFHDWYGFMQNRKYCIIY